MQNFETFGYSDQNSLNFSSKFWNDKSVLLRYFASFFIVMTQNFSVNFKLMHFLLWIKGSIKVPILRLLSILGKICQIFHVIFQTASPFFFKLCITLQCYETSLLCTFLAQTFHTLIKKIPLKCNFWDFRVLRSIFVKFFMSILKWQVNSFSNFASLFIVVTRNFSLNFKLIHFLLWMKGSNESPNFWTFECSGKNLPNSSCHFPNNKSVFLQILHHSSEHNSSVFFLFKHYILCSKETIKVQIFKNFGCLHQNSSNSSCQFWNDKFIPLQILRHSSLSWHITHL